LKHEHAFLAVEEDWSMLLVEEALNLYYAVCKTLIMSHLFYFLVICILVLAASLISLELKWQAFDCQEEGVIYTAF